MKRIRIKHKVKQGDKETYRQVQEYYFKKGYRWCSTGTDIWYPSGLDRRDEYIIAETDINHLSSSHAPFDDEITPNFMCYTPLPDELFKI